MFRMMEVLLYTPDMDRMRAFYERVVGLELRTASPDWTAYETGGALLALRPLSEGQAPYIELTFATDDLEKALRTLQEHGVAIAGEARMHGWGRVARFRDPEGNALAVAQPTHPVKEGAGLVLGTAIVHTRDLAATKSFYHHIMGLRIHSDDPGWVEFDTGATHLALRPRTGASPEPGRSLAFGFRVADLIEWAEAARARGLHFTTAPHDQDWGLFSDALDPDGHRVTFFEPAGEPALEEELAEKFEDDGVPHQIAIRKPVKKGSKAASRVALKPVYKPKPRGKRKPAVATARRVASVRGAGPAGTRLKPKRATDPRKARAKPATGRLKKAERKVATRKKTAVARASKSKPLKRAASRGDRKDRKGASRKGGGRKR